MSAMIVPKAFTILPADIDKRGAIVALAAGLVKAKKLAEKDVQRVIEETMQRETVGSTGIGHGIGIPHCKTTLVDRILCAFGHCSEGLDFDSLDGKPVHSVFLLITPVEQREQHLLLMRQFVAQIRKEHFSEFLHQVTTAQALVDLLAEFEAR